MPGLRIVDGGRAYDVPGAIDAQGGPAIQRWLDEQREQEAQAAFVAAQDHGLEAVSALLDDDQQQHEQFETDGGAPASSDE